MRFLSTAVCSLPTIFLQLILSELEVVRCSPALGLGKTTSLAIEGGHFATGSERVPVLTSTSTRNVPHHADTIEELETPGVRGLRAKQNKAKDLKINIVNIHLNEGNPPPPGFRPFHPHPNGFTGTAHPTPAPPHVDPHTAGFGFGVPYYAPPNHAPPPHGVPYHTPPYHAPPPHGQTYGVPYAPVQPHYSSPYPHTNAHAYPYPSVIPPKKHGLLAMLQRWRNSFENWYWDMKRRFLNWL